MTTKALERVAFWSAILGIPATWAYMARTDTGSAILMITAAFTTAISGVARDRIETAKRKGVA